MQTNIIKKIKVGEAAKVIENTQRDVNIALMNELSIIFHRHCIGVDPCCFTCKAKELGYHPEVILSGCRINDSMGNKNSPTRSDRLAQRRFLVRGTAGKHAVKTIKKRMNTSIKT